MTYRNSTNTTQQGSILDAIPIIRPNIRSNSNIINIASRAMGASSTTKNISKQISKPPRQIKIIKPQPTKKEIYNYNFDLFIKCLDNRDYTTKDAYLNKLYDLDPAKTHFLLGKMYENGSHVVQDRQKAIEHYQEAYNLGNDKASLNLGKIYFRARQIKQGLFYLHESADKLENIEAMNELGKFYFVNRKNKSLGLSYLQKAADRGNTEANYSLARMYMEGKDIKQDYSKAIEHFRRAGNLGCSDAFYDLGVLYWNGFETTLFTGEIGIVENTSLGFYYFDLAAKMGNANAIYSLGFLHFYGIIAKEDPKMGIQYLRQAVELGNGKATKMLEREDIQEFLKSQQNNEESDEGENEEDIEENTEENKRLDEMRNDNIEKSAESDKIEDSIKSVDENLLPKHVNQKE